MKPHLIFYLLITISILISKSTTAQCEKYPADCPSNLQLPDSAERFGNPILPEEVSMEISLHDYFTNSMQELAEKKKWEVYQYDESAGSGHLNGERSGPLAFNLRPPHDYEISFVFIVNKDSLKAWKDWYKELEVKMQELVDQMKSGKAINANSLQEEKKKKDTEFRNACLIRVKIGINQESAIATSIEEDIRITGQLNIPHSVVAYQIHNDKTDDHALFDMDQFKRCTDMAFILFGSWNPKPDNYKRYFPSYTADRKNTDGITPKKIACDKVRTIAIHVEGAPDYINQFLHSLEIESLSSLINN